VRRLNQRRELLLAFKKLRRSAADLSVDRGRFEDVMLCLFRHRIRNIQARPPPPAPHGTGTGRRQSAGLVSRESCVVRRTSHGAPAPGLQDAQRSLASRSR
jgi:hypothetical protein